jgi:hypothetical protein
MAQDFTRYAVQATNSATTGFATKRFAVAMSIAL